MEKLINYFNVDISHHQQKEFLSSLRELTTILFAVVIGLSLPRFLEADHNEIIGLAVALFVVFWSWYGYHQGITIGPGEKNKLNFFIDYLLLLDYWLIMNTQQNLNYVIAFYSLMFALYTLWEYVREKVHKNDIYYNLIERVKKINFLFTLLVVQLWTINYYHLERDFEITIYISILVLYIIYRNIVGREYKNYDVKKFVDSKNNYKELIDCAVEISKNAYAPLSNFKVGAAVLSSGYNIYKGCNVEYLNYSNTVHAEESALCMMVNHGVYNPVAIAVYTSGDKINFPCGMCLQSLYEMGGEDLQVIACNDFNSETIKIKELMPHGFKF